MWLFYHCYKCGLNCYEDSLTISRVSYTKFHLITCDLLRPSGINYRTPPTRSTPGLAWKIDILDTRVVIETLSSYNERDTIYIDSDTGYTVPYSFNHAVRCVYNCLSIAGMIPENSGKFKV